MPVALGVRGIILAVLLGKILYLDRLPQQLVVVVAVHGVPQVRGCLGVLAAVGFGRPVRALGLLGKALREGLQREAGKAVVAVAVRVLLAVQLLATRVQVVAQGRPHRSQVPQLLTLVAGVVGAAQARALDRILVARVAQVVVARVVQAQLLEQTARRALQILVAVVVVLAGVELLIQQTLVAQEVQG